MKCYAKEVATGYAVVGFTTPTYYTAHLTPICHVSGNPLVFNPEMHDKLVAAATLRVQSLDLLVEAMMQPLDDFIDASRAQCATGNGTVEGKLEQIARMAVAQDLAEAVNNAISDRLCNCTKQAQVDATNELINDIEGEPTPTYNFARDILEKLSTHLNGARR
jgi:hypothetical protein